MVSKFCFELDKKGILPFWFENEYIYLKRGENLIKKYEHFDLEDAFEKTKIKYKEDKEFLRDISCGPIGREKIKKGAESVLAKYGYDLSWIKGIYFIHKGFSLKRLFFEIGGWSMCDFPRDGNYDGYLLPFISINVEIGNKIDPNRVIIHELIHAARQGICIEATIEKDLIKQMDDKAKKGHILRVKSYEEAFADSIKSINWIDYKVSIGQCKQLIKKAKKTLEEHLGESTGYVLGRLTYDETKDITHSNENPIDFIAREAKNSLRLQIIKEKLEKG